MAAGRGADRRRGITARQVLTRDAFENAIAVVMAFGGSTNAVLHLLAIAHEAGVALDLDDFTRVGERVPHLADVKPFGRYLMSTIDQVGGVPVVMKALLDTGPAARRRADGHWQDRGREPRGDRSAGSGRGGAARAGQADPPHGRAHDPPWLSGPRWRCREDGGPGRGAIRGHGAGVRRRGGSDGRSGGPAARRRRGDSLRGPKGAPGMREMLAGTAAIKGAGLGKDVLC